MMYFARWKVILILAILTLRTIIAIPNLLPHQIKQSIPGWLPHPTVSLGLDLQGGSYLLLAADTDSLMREKLTTVVDDFRAGLRGAKISYTDIGIEGRTAKVKLINPAQIEAARPILQNAATGMTLNIASDGAVVASYDDAVITQIVRTAMENSVEVVRRRIDVTGTLEPTIQLQGSDRILVELPGISDPERIKARLGSTAKMTFRFVDDSVNPDAANTGALPPTDEVLPLSGPAVGGEAPLYVVQKSVMISAENP